MTTPDLKAAALPATTSDVEKLKAAAELATPGPWQWRQSHAGRIDLAAPHGGGTVVMDFIRHGMKGAQPRFALCPDGLPRGRRGGIMYSASELIEADAEKMLTHPDAEFIALANPTTIKVLIERLQVAEDAVKRVINIDASNLNRLADGIVIAGATDNDAVLLKAINELLAAVRALRVPLPKAGSHA